MSEAKFDMGKIVAKIKKNFDNDERLSNKIGTGDSLKELTEKDFIVLGDWWQKPTGLFGIPKGRVTLLAGAPDSSKTAFAVHAMKAALDQGFGVILCESENKTTEVDLRAVGIDPSQLIVVQATIAEELFELLFDSWDAFKEYYPDVPLFIVVDSLGNVISQRDADIDLTEQSSQPGGKGKINRIGLNKMVAKLSEDNTAILLISYTYDNMGSVGKTNAGGNALNYFSSLTYQTSRKSWLEKTVKGKKVRYGIEAVWKLYKNHICKDLSKTDKEILFRITDKGFEWVNPEEKKIKNKEVDNIGNDEEIE